MNNFSLDDFITQATCAVLIDEQIVGTAWLLSAEGYLLTAAHVVPRDSEEVRVQFVDHAPLVAYVEIRCHKVEDGIDFAVLKLAQPIKRRPLPIALARKCEGEFEVRGYGRSFSRTGSQWGGGGKFGTPQTVQHSTSDVLFVLNAAELNERGFSGAAVYSLTPKAVVGMVIKRAPFIRELVVALPLYRIAEYWPHLTEIAEQKKSRSPYVGLQTFQEDDAEFFYGRESLVARLVEKLANSPFLAVLGPSGSGKSSVVRAGLLSALKKGALTKSEQWHYLIIKPTARPLDALAVALNKLEGENLGDMEAWRKVLAEDERALLLAADRGCAGNSDRRLVLVIDQFEELWTLAPTEAEARASFIAQKQKPFIRLLLTAIEEQRHTTAPSLLIILTMRADFLHRAAENRPLANAIAEADVIVTPLAPDELRRAIEGPLKRILGVFETGLVDELITQTSQREGALPLLQYTLAELWQAAEPNLYGIPTMRWHTFRALGGVEGALAQRADTILEQEYTAEQQQQLRHLLVRLVQPGEGAADTRRRIPLEELTPADSASEQILNLLNPLIKHRLLTTAHDTTIGQQTIEVSHEALIRAWPTLTDWIEEARDDLRFHLQLEEAAKEWQTHDQNPDFLWSGLRLANAREWLHRTQPQLNQRDQRFLNASRDAEEARIADEEARQREREELLEARAAAERRNLSQLRLFLFVGSVLLLVVIIFFGIAFNRQPPLTNVARMAVGKLAELQSTQALFELSNNPDRALLLALAAIRFDVESPQLVVSRALRDTVETMLIRQVFAGHTSWVTSVASSPTGEQVATGSSDHTARLWDAQTGQLMHTLQGHTSWVTSVAFSPTREQVLTSSRDNTARLWDAQTGKELHTLQGHTESVTSVAFSPTGKQVLTGSWDNTARLWNVQTGKVLHILQGHTSSITSVAFSPTGKLVATGSDDNTTRLWDPQMGSVVITLRRHTSSITSVVFSPTGEQLLTGSNDGMARLWDVQTKQLMHTLRGHTSWITSVVFSPTGEQLLTGSNDGMARLWDAQTGQLIHILQGHTDNITSVAFSPTGEQVLTGSWDNTARLWDAQTGQLIHILRGHTSSVESVAFISSGEKLLTGSNDGTVRLWNTQMDTEIRTLQGHTDDVTSVAFSPTGKLLLTGSSDNTARLWDAQIGTQIHTLQGHIRDVTSVAFSPTEEQVLTGSDDNTARLWDAQTGTSIQTLQGHTDEVKSVTFSPTGAFILTGSTDETARLWQTGKEQHTLEGHTDDVTSVAFNPTGEQVLTGSIDRTARLWDTQTDQLIHTLQHTSSVESVAFSPTGEMVATGSWDNTARLWDAQAGKELHTLQGHTSSITSVVFSPTGEQVATGSEDQTARLWDVQTGKEQHILQGHTEGVRGVAFSPTGEQVLIGSANGTARLWIADDNLLIAKLTSLVCVVWGHREEAIRAEIPDWGGCEVELEAVKEDLARYEELHGR